MNPNPNPNPNRLDRILQTISDNAPLVMIAVIILFVIVGVLDWKLGPVVDGYAHIERFRP
jgi:hypothetical protein